MKAIYIIIFIVIFSSLYSCTQKRERQIKVTSMNKASEVTSMNNTRPIDLLRELVSNGDTMAYEELGTALMGKEYYDEYLMYSMVMANKYKYPRAYFQVYYCLTSFFKHHAHAGLIDEKTEALAIEYLKIGVELNNAQSMEELGNLYLEGKYVPKNTILGKKLYKKGRIRFGDQY